MRLAGGSISCGRFLSRQLVDYRYGEIKKYMSARREVHVLDLSSAEFLAASGAAGIATAICTNPFWVVKTRMVTTDGSAIGSYTGLYGINSVRSTNRRWTATDTSKRRNTRIILWFDTITNWGLPRCSTIHVL